MKIESLRAVTERARDGDLSVEAAVEYFIGYIDALIELLSRIEELRTKAASGRHLGTGRCTPNVKAGRVQVQYG